MNGFDALVEKIRDELNKVMGRKDWSLILKEEGVSYSEKLALGKYELRVPDAVERFDGTLTDTLVASFELHPMINCCGICVSSRAYVAMAWRHRGINNVLNSLRIDIARHLDYSVLLCTDDVSNIPQRKTLSRNGWRDIFRFVNRRTNHTVAISVINL